MLTTWINGQPIISKGYKWTLPGVYVPMTGPSNINGNLLTTVSIPFGNSFSQIEPVDMTGVGYISGYDVMWDPDEITQNIPYQVNPNYTIRLSTVAHFFGSDIKVWIGLNANWSITNPGNLPSQVGPFDLYGNVTFDYTKRV